MQPTILKKDVLAYTSIQHLNLPSVTKIENYAFRGSKLRFLIVENCELVEELAFDDDYNNVQRDV